MPLFDIRTLEDEMKAALVQQHCFYELEAPIARVTGWDTPYPPAQEWDYFPGPARVGQALIETMEA